MANTVIQLKYSNVTAQPPSLNVSEPAYSNVSGVLWIDDGTGVVAIGGRAYTEIIDNRTEVNTANTIVLRDFEGNFSANQVTANLLGNLSTPRQITLSGDANGSVYFDASEDVTITVDLTESGVVAESYGGTTAIPVFTVDLDGRITYAANVNVATSFSISSDNGSDTIDLLEDTLTFTGGDGVTTTIDSGNNVVTFDVDETVVRTSGGQIISGDLQISGNLIVSGDQVIQDVTIVRVEDSLIHLAANNPNDGVDIGFFGEYINETQKFAGLVRDNADGVFKLFTEYGTIPSSNDVSWGADIRATLDANFTGGNVHTLATAINVTDGGTGLRESQVGDIIYGTGVNSLGMLAKPASTNSFLRMDSAGVPVWIDTIPVENGGTGNTTFTSNGVLLGQGTSAVTTVVSETEGHVLTINSSGAPEFAFLSGGTF